MSDDLISRKALIDVLNGVDGEGLLKIRQIIEILEDEPIAFDKKKVLEELERASRLYSISDKGCEFAIPQNIALEIVEKGGV